MITVPGQKLTYSPATEHVTVIVNTHSGVRRGQRVVEMLKNNPRNIPVAVFETLPRSYDGHRAALEYAREHNSDRLIVCGGDGTLMETLTIMLNENYPVPIYVIPVGTGNVVASDLSVPRRIRPAIRQALQPGVMRWWEAGQIAETGQCFVLRASAGHDA
ncbi:MAG TPA: acylglycerol kinase family protein, partial [Aggregatilineales bacterium]|nr:acylglycerol kinase family protein [Aggregatilineales bacterium]